MERFDPADAGRLLRAARHDAALTQNQLAQLAGVAQANLAAIEAGRRTASAEMLERLLEAADYRPTVALRLNRERLLSRAAEHRISGIRVFGSVLRGEDHFDSDIDLIVDAAPDDYLAALAYGEAAASLTGFPVDLHIAGAAAESEFGRGMLVQSVPL